ncbi:class I SAM-dependent methyltransferase [Actinosynnema sp. NPDC020468]|uniref:class I SAM-dependent methyltransferase n=1 Tax=Actinosynnema sp. NPDC020468 TaxID=3154488 RepID=UPI0033C5F106
MVIDEDAQRRMAANRANWDARTPIHAASHFYGRNLHHPENWFADFEWHDLGDLHDRDLVHLQCHIGTETIALARRGAHVTGLDFSAASITEARRIAAAHQVQIDYVHADVHDAVTELGTNRFDIVYTGKGALCYLPDLPTWAAIVHDLLKPGGLVYIAEFHPLLNALGPKPTVGSDLLLRNDYLSGRGPQRQDSTHTYTDGPALNTATVSHEWRHGLGDLINALIGAGLTIRHLTETDALPWQRWPTMTQDTDTWWRLPPESPRIPLLFGLRATKPEHRLPIDVDHGPHVVGPGIAQLDQAEEGMTRKAAT